MRPVIVCNVVSLDGYYADASGDPPFAGMDAAFDEMCIRDRVWGAQRILASTLLNRETGPLIPRRSPAGDAR